MPKTGNLFKIQIAFHVQNDLYEKVVALGYMRGRKGTYASVARDLLGDAVDNCIQGLSNDEKGQFRQILEAVKAEVLIKQMEREEKLKGNLEIKEPSLDLQEPSDQDRGQ